MKLKTFKDEDIQKILSSVAMSCYRSDLNKMGYSKKQINRLLVELGIKEKKKGDRS